jgi:SPP1 gp7 family putative phage head morphogenesis protein
MTWRVGSKPQAYLEALAWFRSKVPMLKADYQALSTANRRKAFTVAGVTQLDLIHDVWKEIDNALENGMTLEDFKSTVSAKLTRAWGAPNPARVETIFRTNMQSAYGAGRYAQLTDPDVLETRPYWMYDSILDSRTSGLCRSLDGTVKRNDDPWWDKRIPPLHHRCRSAIRSFTEEQANARGITSNPPNLEPNEGFGIRPDLNEWQPNPQKYPSVLWDILESQRMERSPRLNPQQLPKNERIPKDALLRGASPEEVAGAVRAWLAERLPSARGVTVTLARDPEDLARIGRRWKRLCRLQGISEDRVTLDVFDRGVTMFGEILLLPEVVTELESLDTVIRARGARTIMHEWWHGARFETARFYAFEEGAADVFADAMYQKAFGVASVAPRAYDELAEAIELIGTAIDNPNWYFASRTQTSVLDWLRQELTAHGFNAVAINQVLSYTANDGAWLVRVRQMIATKEQK